MKLFYFLLILLSISSCSFDKKTGIWKDENSSKIKDNQLFKDFKKISSSEKIFKKKVILDKNFNFKLLKPIKNSSWKDPFYNKSNNLANFKYNSKNELIFQSKKLTRSNLSKYLLYENNNIIINDEKGNIIIYSVKDKNILKKFNFYNKRYKNFKKKLNLIVEENIIYVSDNIGYLYAYNIISKKIVWAKNYKIPFKSNLKILGSNLIAANQDNNIYFFNKKNGEILKSIPTEETIVKNQFVNNFSISNDNLIFLNSFGSLYSIDIKSKRINWFINLNQSMELTTSNLFNSNQIVNHNKRIVVSTNKRTYFIDSQTGNIINKKPFTSNFGPIIHNNYIFFLTTNNLLIGSDLNTGEIYYAYDAKEQIKNKSNTKKKISFQNFMLGNGKLIIFFNNSNISFFNIEGIIDEIKKLSGSFKTNPIFINGRILYFDNKNKLKIFN